ncbi:MAG: sulfotransferase [Alphaproteobacteria bacterium]|nr:sulfotransferase [Alphaproteobacteria bacterium]
MSRDDDETMTLAVIGAGFGRTGTDSMKAALELLGFGPCHHMKEVLASEEQTRIWRAIAAGGTPDWDKVFADFNACVDWPSAFYWRQISAHWPEAKILLTVRDSESWYRSMEQTIFRVVRQGTDMESLGRKLIESQVFGGNIDDREAVIAAFERNTAEVQAAFGPDRLLTYHIGDGWEPLCRFLGVPVPDQDFPRTNSTAEFQKFTARMINTP